MLLYHGTSDRHVESILISGLLPRLASGSNWEAASCQENVYLTTAYAIYFAQNARSSFSEGLAIVEIDTALLADQDALLADEDALAYLWAKGGLADPDGPRGVRDPRAVAVHYASRLRYVAAAGYGHEISLEVMGNCSHEGAIPASAITRVVTFSSDGGPWWLQFHDPVVSPLNFRYQGSEYVATQLAAVGRMAEARAVPQPMPGFLDLDMVEALCAPRRRVLDLERGRCDRRL